MLPILHIIHWQSLVSLKIQVIDKYTLEMSK